MEDASLDDFLDADSGADTADDDSETGPTEGDTEADTPEDEGGAEIPDVEAERPDPASVDPARTTHQWTPEGVTCDACGQVVERRWTADEGLVCADCKEW